jgi:hypothetical protein
MNILLEQDRLFSQAAFEGSTSRGKMTATLYICSSRCTWLLSKSRSLHVVVVKVEIEGVRKLGCAIR